MVRPSLAKTLSGKNPDALSSQNCAHSTPTAARAPAGDMRPSNVLLKSVHAASSGALVPSEDEHPKNTDSTANLKFYQALAKGFVVKVADCGLAAKVQGPSSHDQREGSQFYRAPVRFSACARTAARRLYTRCPSSPCTVACLFHNGLCCVKCAHDAQDVRRPVRG